MKRGENESIEQLRPLYDKIQFLRKISRNYVFLIGYACNLACSYCFQRAEGSILDIKSHLDAILSPSLAAKAFNVIENHSSQSKTPPTVEISGGEPLLPHYHPSLNYILSKCQERGYPTFLTTNGTHLVDSIKLLQGRISVANITLDGPQIIHNRRRPFKSGEGSFLRISKGIKAAQDALIPIQVKVTVDTQNVDHLPEFGMWVEEQGWFDNPNIKFGLTLVVPYSGTPSANSYAKYQGQMVEKIVEILKNHSVLNRFDFVPQGGGWFVNSLLGGESLPVFRTCDMDGTFVFDALGNIYSCIRAAGNSDWQIGTYYPHFRITSKFWNCLKTRSVYTLEKCQKCAFALICGGGCPYDAYLASGAIDTPYCRAYTQVIDTWLPYFYQKYVRNELSSRDGEE
ncbi:MAG: radical SAM protein [Candidatus Hodarchaeota archaeon]